MAYTFLQVVRLPTNSYPNLVHDQALKLYAEIEQGCHSARERKSELRMLLDAKLPTDYRVIFSMHLIITR
jgi:hypothetical protein